MTTTYFNLGAGNLVQDWTNIGLITADNNWADVPSITGYRGDDLTTGTGTDPRTITGTSTVVSVEANETNPNVFNTGGVAEFQIADPTVALNGSGTADAPYLVLFLDATGRQDVRVQLSLRDIDASVDNASQQIAIQYRVGGGTWTNVPGGFFADVTTASTATQVTSVDLILPAAANNEGQVEVRVLTTNAVGNDEWVGIDNINVSSSPVGPAAQSLVSLTVDDASRPEGETYTYTVTLAAPAQGDTVVTLAGSGATGDTAGVPASVTVLDGQTTAAFTVASTEDTTVETNETFTVTATLGSASQNATATIENDDSAPTNNFGGITILDQAQSLAGSTTAPVATNAVNVYRIAGVLGNGGAGGAGVAESITFDPSNDRAFVTNAAQDRIDILDFSVPSSPISAGSISLTSLPGFAYGEVNSVAVRSGIVAVAIQNADGGENGIVALFDGGTGALIKTLTVGALPDQLTFSPDGSLLLVANEGERFYDTSGSTPVVENAPGTITVISVPANAADAVVRNTVGFTALDAFEDQLDALGIKTLDATSYTYDPDGNGPQRSVTIQVPDSTVSQDLEPEYIAVSPDGTRAYVTIQEANTVAVIDLTNAGATSPISLLPLGAVDFSLPGNEGDFSDRDGTGASPSISIGNSPVKGLLQPDAIATFAVAGETYFVTANEGDSRILSGGGLGDPALNEARASAVRSGAPADYARVNVDTVWSTSSDLYAFGGRGFSVFKQNADGTIVKVDETGGDFEQIVAALPNAATVFNGENGGGFDTRSDNKAAEPEGVAVGEVNGVPYAFVAVERLGGIMVWDLSTPSDVQFVRYIAPATTDYGPEVIKFVSATDSPNGRAMVITANEVSGSVTAYEVTNDTRIFDIQGAGHRSSMVGQQVVTRGIVTAIDRVGTESGGNNPVGYWIQDAEGDGNYRTSDAVFVFLGAGASATIPAGIAVGNEIRLTATVSEFASGTQASTTQLTPVGAVTVLSQNNTLPTAVRIGDVNDFTTGLERKPALVSLGDDDIDASPEAPSVYDPVNQGSDFWESLEGMRVTLEDVRVTGPFRSNFDEQFVVPDVGMNPSDNERGGLTIRDTTPGTVQPANKVFDLNPEKIQLDDEAGIALPTGLTTGDRLGDVTGVVHYANSQYEVNATEAYGPVTAANLERETTTIVESFDRIRVASFNVENLAPVGQPVDGAPTPASKYEGLANAIVNNLRAPEILALQEVLDNDGATNTAATSAAGTLAALIQAIVDAGGPRYQAIDSRPVDDTVGGIPGGNQRVAYLFNPEAVTPTARNGLTTVSGTPAGITVYEERTEDQIGQDNPDFNATRKSLSIEWSTDGYTDAQGGTFHTVNNHLSSKGGSAPLYGTDLNLPLYADPLNGSAQSTNGSNEREGQAETVNAYVDGILTNASSTDDRIVVLGDLNDFQFFPVVDLITGQIVRTQANPDGTASVFAPGTAVLAELAEKLAPEERYSYNFDGNAQALDHILVSNDIFDSTLFDIVHINSEFVDQISDHDPSVASLLMTRSAAIATAGDDTFDQASYLAKFGSRRGSLDGDDIIDGLGGNDTIAAGSGNDLVNGGDGSEDTAVYSGTRSGYVVETLSATSFRVTDTRTGGDGVDTVTGVEFFQFSDGTFSADDLTGRRSFVENGSFERFTAPPQQVGYFDASSLEGWTVSGGGIELVTAEYGRGAPSDGLVWLDMEAAPSNITISQEVDGLTAGRRYVIEADAFDSYGFEGGNAVQVFLEGNLVGTMDPTSRDPHPYTFDVVATGATDTLEFRSIGNGDNVGVSLDNVRMFEDLNFVRNGSFERFTSTSFQGGYYDASALDGWTVTGGQIELVTAALGRGEASDGDVWLDMGASPGNIAISQEITGLTDGRSYTVRVDAFDSRGAGGNDAVDVFFAGARIGTIDPVSTQANAFEFAFTATGASGTLSFEGLGVADDQGVSIDDVALFDTLLLTASGSEMRDDTPLFVPNADLLV